MDTTTAPTLDTTTPPTTDIATAQRPRRRRGGLLILVALLVAGLLIYWNVGLYTVQPIGALPQGATIVVWRAGNEPFFNSPDAVCLRAQGGVSLLCRGVALGAAPTKRIVLRLPYQHWAYLVSTGGQTFSK